MVKALGNGLFEFKNGAQAKKLANGQYRIVKGAPKAYMDKIRSKAKGVAKYSSRSFGKGALRGLYSRGHMAASKGNRARANKSMKSDWARRNKKLLNLASGRVRRSIRRNPGRLVRADVRNLDDGTKRRRAPRKNSPRRKR